MIQVLSQSLYSSPLGQLFVLSITISMHRELSKASPRNTVGSIKTGLRNVHGEVSMGCQLFLPIYHLLSKQLSSSRTCFQV